MFENAVIVAAQRGDSSNAVLHTTVLGLIMLLGTGVVLWLLLKYGNRGA